MYHRVRGSADGGAAPARPGIRRRVRWIFAGQSR